MFTDQKLKSSNFVVLHDLIQNNKAIIGVIGLGYVGLPLAVGFAERGYTVFGVELDVKKIDNINNGINYIGDVDSERLKYLVAQKRLSATADFAALKNADVIVICVPTPLNKTGDPDVSFIIAARDSIRDSLRPGQLVTLESTTYPGTVDEVILPYFAETGLKVGEDYFLAFSPERIDPSNATFQVDNTPKVVGGVTSSCTEVACAFYAKLVGKVIPVSSTRAAEMVKILENTFRAINIGLANEIAIICRKLGLDVWEVIDAAASKPFGFMPFYPGPGLGGHCIPIDPSYLAWKLREQKYHTRFIDLATQVNSSMPEYVIELVVEILNDESKAVRNARILILGVAYKRDIDDLRESPALDIIQLLRDRGAFVEYHDSHVPHIDVAGDITEPLTSIPLTEKLLQEQDLVIVVTDHSSFDYNFICQHSKLILDTRNATKGIKNSAARIVKL